MLYMAKSQDKEHKINEIISFEKAKGHTAFYGEGLYFSDRVEVSYTRGSGCIYVLDEQTIETTLVKDEEVYKWYVVSKTTFKVIKKEFVSVKEALSQGWNLQIVDFIEKQRKGFEFYYVQPF